MWHYICPNTQHAICVWMENTKSTCYRKQIVNFCWNISSSPKTDIYRSLTELSHDIDQDIKLWWWSYEGSMGPFRGCLISENGLICPSKDERCHIIHIDGSVYIRKTQAKSLRVEVDCDWWCTRLGPIEPITLTFVLLMPLCHYHHYHHHRCRHNPHHCPFMPILQIIQMN